MDEVTAGSICAADLEWPLAIVCFHFANERGDGRLCEHATLRPAELFVAAQLLASG